MTQLANVDQRGDEVFVWSSSKTVVGAWIANGLFRRLPATAGAGELGDAAVWALGESHHGIPHPDLRSGPLPLTPMLNAISVKTWSKYVRGLRSVTLEREGEQVTVTPYETAPDKNLIPLNDLAIRLTDPTADQLGSALAEALASCK